ncbi:hypothetical protein DRP53_05395 [candidate division WOR-3 bacterium]|uniref:Uncharacterized protein n=1 Tax=candidate division WOR-3 bacterium TaxID=2052148 RepID=A0A660SJN5_UNCW3|nr:MAG: hypothetical protein DRP53_05395 [candidate division WOR-3 bacterium]
MRLLSFWGLLSVFVFLARGADNPIIFVHGIHGAHLLGGRIKPKDCWPDWNGIDFGKPYRTAMDKILIEHYGGYTAGSPLDCHVNTELIPTGGETRKIYNFSYYNPDGDSGAIGSNGDILPEGCKVWKTTYIESSKSDDLWIPPGLYDEPSCIGCCLFSFGAGLVGYEIYKSLKDTTRKEYYPKFSIGIGYSPGIAYRGVLSRLLESGEMDPFYKYYWNNQAHVDLTIPISVASFVKLSVSYIWARIDKTGTLFRPPDGHFCAGENRWEFSSRSFAISLGHYLERNEGIQIEAGIEYYVWDGQDHEIKAYTFEPVKIKIWGNGICGLVNAGINKAITKWLIWNMNLSLRFSKGTEKGYSSSEAVEKLTPIEFHLTGTYINFGVKYVFKKIQNGGVR